MPQFAIVAIVLESGKEGSIVATVRLVVCV
jgi:hypothetical protein